MVTSKTKPVQESTNTKAHFMPKEDTAFYFVAPNGNIVMKRFEKTAENLGLVYMGNAFKEPEDAVSNKEAVLQKYGEFQ